MLKKILLFGLCILFLIQLVSATEYTFDTKKEYIGEGKYNLIIGKDWYADENGTLMSELSSLKECQFCDNIKLVIDEDKDYPIEIIDYNLTSIRFNILSSEKVLDTNVEIKILDKSNISNVLIDTVSSKITSIEDKKEILSEFGFDKIIKVGSNSTTIILTTTDILGDSYVSSALPDDNYGSQVYLMQQKTSTYTRHSILQFNTQFPENFTLFNSKINLYLFQNNLDVTTEGYYLSARSISKSYNWTELGITYNNAPIDTYLGNKTEHIRFRSDTPINTYYSWQVNNILSYSVYNNYYNTSFYIYSDDYFGSPASTDYLYFRSRDYTSNRPFLNVTYEIKNFEYFEINTNNIYEQSIISTSNNLGVMAKINISSIPSSKTFKEAYYCNYIAFTQYTPDLDTEIRRIDNQTWTVPVNDFSYTNYTNTSLLSSNSLYDHFCLNITDVIKEDYYLGNEFSSFLLNDLDYKINTASLSAANPDLYIGQAGASPQLVFPKKGGSNYYLPTSYIKIFYLEQEVPPAQQSYYDINCSVVDFANDHIFNSSQILRIFGVGNVTINGTYNCEKTIYNYNECRVAINKGGSIFPILG